MLLAELAPQASATTADPRPLHYVTAAVIGALALWVIYTLLTAKTRKGPDSAPAKPTYDPTK